MTTTTRTRLRMVLATMAAGAGIALGVHLLVTGDFAFLQPLDPDPTWFRH